MRLLFLCVVAFLALGAEDTLLLNANVRMIPKIMALNARLSSKDFANQAILGIIYADNHKTNAKNIADKMNRLYNGKIANLSFVATPISVEDLMGRRDLSFVYVTQMSESSTARIGAWGIANAVPTFAYDISGLEHGILGSIAIERDTVIYISKTALKTGKFHFNDTLFQIARLIE